MTVHEHASDPRHAAPAWRPFAAAGVLAALIVVVHHRTFTELWHVWQTNDNYSHGPLVPIASAAIIWMRRAAFLRAPERPSAWGLAVVGFGCLLQIAGVRADVFALQGYSIVALLFGVSLTFFGVRRTRVLAFPLGFLMFMLTFPPFVVNQLSYALKEITVRLSTTMSEWLGVTLQRSGMTLYLSGGELRMENPCSGMRSLLSLLATGALFAWFQPGGVWSRAAVFAAAIPIAMLGNAVRTTLLIVVGHYAGVEAAGGFVHDASGYLVYAVALVGLLALRHALAPRASRKVAPA